MKQLWKGHYSYEKKLTLTGSNEDSVMWSSNTYCRYEYIHVIKWPNGWLVASFHHEYNYLEMNRT